MQYRYIGYVRQTARFGEKGTNVTNDADKRACDLHFSRAEPNRLVRLNHLVLQFIYCYTCRSKGRGLLPGRKAGLMAKA